METWKMVIGVRRRLIPSVIAGAKSGLLPSLLLSWLGHFSDFVSFVNFVNMGMIQLWPLSAIACCSGIKRN
jgi:hypothetical protein